MQRSYLVVAGVAAMAFATFAQQALAEGPYKVVKTVKVGGAGGFDYVYADANARGVAVDPKSHHGFGSSKPVVMWDTKTLATIKTIDVEGGPDGILFDPFNDRVWVFSHRAPNATVINAKDGSVAGK